MNNSNKELQKILLDMLYDLDTVCKKHGIKYMLYAGSALGAVRHSGFIPWDDDLDIIMLRGEYERFLRFASEELSAEKYYLQKEYSDHWPMFFSKLRLNNTSAMEKFHVKDPEMHQGVYIDIFPCDNLSDNEFVAKMQFFASRIVVAKSLDKRGYLTDSRAKKVFMAMCRLLPNKPFYDLCVMRRAVGTKRVNSFLACSSRYEKSVFKREWIEECTQMKFCDGVFPVSAHYDELLTAIYGDYMTPPSEEERKCKEHFAILDFENSYECHLEEQKNMTVNNFSRSIR